MPTIERLILKNFKKFRDFDVSFDDKLNILAGGNEAGKSSILQAIDLALSSSRSKVEALGVETIFSAQAISEFLGGNRNVANLPVLHIEVYFKGLGDQEFDGRNNSLRRDGCGIRVSCLPMDEYTGEIKKALADRDGSFPFEFYEVRFRTFADRTLLPYRKPLKHLLIDSSQINNDYANRDYTRAMYVAQSTPSERNKHAYQYRKAKRVFRDTSLKAMNDTIVDYKFDVRSSSKSSIESDLVITEDDIPIEGKGKGRQCFIKTEFALRNRESALDLLLLEEPENHLSHVHMHKLIERIDASKDKQLFIATHSSFIATRLNLRKVLLLNDAGAAKPASLQTLTDDTARFFMKAPDNNVLELSLCSRAILVEGDAEFILLGALYEACSGGSSTEKDGIHVISVDGTSFKRYMELAKVLGIKVAVVRDNDNDYQLNCVENYEDFVSDKIRVFADPDPARSTFEICIYQDNTKSCDDLFAAGRRTLSVQDYMLENKTEVAFRLLEKHGKALTVPPYIEQAIAWIRG
ncbi:ATP-dependent nuclease [Stenotrophomonas indicatrix]|uniref:AAA family ATPase n=1 Tax=Stenotrophomonas indicatrix TaxID=2045451 RepID=A0ABT8QH50_9GAMM|nr:AAA family ATPase [Stenotrophomonas indicatrix]MDN8663725.1 AAA family ATPase [Stenotrophomonas indicatrix]MDN8671215.1 AAA family ATPase [Stenotrophomonas indicatrix]